MVDQILDLPAVAKWLKVSRKTVYRMAENDELPACKVRGQWRFAHGVLDQWIAQRMKSHNLAVGTNPRPERSDDGEEASVSTETIGEASASTGGCEPPPPANHFCPHCGWTGETQELRVLDPADGRSIYLALEPGDTAPSGYCPRCGKYAQPEVIYTGTLPTLVDENGFSLPPSWEAIIHRGRNSLIFYLYHPQEGHMAEIIIDAHGERPRLEITSFRDDDVDAVEQGSQLQLSIGEAHVAIWPASTSVPALVVDDEGIYQSPDMTEDFYDLTDWARRPDK